MPPRVVTVDIEAMLGNQARLIAAVARPYDPDRTGLTPWAGGYYIDALVETDVGDCGTLHPRAHEYGDDMPGILLDQGVGHTFLGWSRPSVTPAQLPEGTRRAVVTVDLGRALAALLTRADYFEVDPTSAALEVLVNGGPGATDGSNLHPRAYDALEDHPPRLRAALERRRTRRRRRRTDPPGDWNNRRQR